MWPVHDLAALIEEDLGEPVQKQGNRPYWYCPFHADKNTPSLTLVPGGKRFKCFGCGKSGGAMVWLMELRGLSQAEAYEEAERWGLADGWHLATVSPGGSSQWTESQPPPKPTKRPPAAPREPDPPTWDSSAALAVARECEAALWSEAGAKARKWLHERGLADDTLRWWRLGYNPADRKIHGLWTPRGIVIPCFVGGVLWYIKIRRPVPGVPGPKYQQVKGGRLALFGLDSLGSRRRVVICEGELDAVLLWQEAGDLVDVVAIGSKAAKPPLSLLAHLAGASRWLVALDNDADGAAGWWAEYSARVRRVRSLQGNDLTDFHQAGGNLRAWVMYHLDRLDAETDPQSVTAATGRSQSKALTRWPDDPPPVEPCGMSERHRRFWRRPTGGWVCAVCHPAPPGLEVGTWTLPAPD